MERTSTVRKWFLALLATVVLGAAACGGSDDVTSEAPEPVPVVAETVLPSTTTTLPCGDAILPAEVSLTATAIAPGELPIYPAPDPAAAPARTMTNPRLINNDPNAAVPLLFLVKDTPDAACDWIEVYLPVRPNGSTGFVKRSDVTLQANPYRIEVRLGEFNLKVFNGSETIMDTDVAVASDNTPTPGGLYYTTELVKTPNPGGVYGPYAYGLSGFSEVLQTFNGGPGQLGIHGTNAPERIGSKVSNGCIRMHNDDITKLAGILPLGVPVQILA
jgi:lipoprotein-anchoring transpeptidase ErfK/SrfK